LVEHTAENRGVAGSIPALAITDTSPALAARGPWRLASALPLRRASV